MLIIKLYYDIIILIILINTVQNKLNYTTVLIIFYVKTVLTLKQKKILYSDTTYINQNVIYYNVIEKEFRTVPKNNITYGCR